LVATHEAPKPPILGALNSLSLPELGAGGGSAKPLH
jgi:hypothetical protein